MSTLRPLPSDSTLFDNTRVNEARVCGRKYYFRHERSWTPDGKRPELTFGGSWHAAQDIIWPNHKLLYGKEAKEVIEAAYKAFIVKWVSEGFAHPDDMSPDDLEALGARTPMIAKEMLSNYPAARKHLFTDPTFELIEVEKPFAVRMDPSDDDLYYVGRLDKVARYKGKTVAFEHKTTTSYKKSAVPFRSDYLDGFSPNGQIDGYLFALRMLYGDQAGGIYVDAALVHKENHSGFIIIPVERQPQMLESWLWTTRTFIDGIFDNRAALAERNHADTDYMAAFPQNTASCHQFGSCAFLPLCKMIANPALLSKAPLGYREEFWNPLKDIDPEKLGFTKRADAA